MLAPSPDWFIGVDSLDLCDNGKWRESWDVTMLPPWDAGTEEGERFSLSNPASNPHVNIFQITNNKNGPFKNDEPIKSLGEFSFKGIGLPVLPQASSTPTASSNTSAPPMDKYTTTAMPTDNTMPSAMPTDNTFLMKNVAGKASVSFGVLLIATSIMAFVF